MSPDKMRNRRRWSVVGRLVRCDCGGMLMEWFPDTGRVLFGMKQMSRGSVDTYNPDDPFTDMAPFEKRTVDAEELAQWSDADSMRGRCRKCNIRHDFTGPALREVYAGWWKNLEK